MAVDRDRYVREVLEPARQADEIPADLWARYALSDGVVNGDLDGHLGDLVSLWKSIGSRTRKYKSIISQLLSKHAALERSGALTATALRAARSRHQAEVRDRLEDEVGWVHKTATHVTPEHADRIAATVGATGDETRQALAAAGVAVADPPELPDGTPSDKYSMLQGKIAEAGAGHSYELLFGPGARFTVLTAPAGSGRAIPAKVAELLAAEDQLGTQGNQPRKEALRILREIAAAGTYQACIYKEVVDALRQKATGRGHRQLTQDAERLGVDAAEAPLVALAVQSTVGGPIDTVGKLAEDVQGLLAAGQLRAAQQALAGAEAATDPRLEDVATRLAAAVDAVNRTVRDAETAQRRGDAERAAELLSQATRQMADDEDLARRLAALPPPPPARASGEVEDRIVRVRWPRSAARVGEVVYRVVRDGTPPASPHAGTEIATTADTEVVDRAPPVATELHYAVFASRTDKVWSDPAVTGEVVVTPELTDVRVEAGPRSVTCKWGADPEVVGVQVVRRSDREPQSADDGSPVPDAHLQGFTDSDVRPGTTYFYLACAVYATTGGKRVVTGGTTVRARPEHKPQVVADLAASLAPNSREPQVELTWTDPGGGLPMIVRSDDPPPWSMGATITARELAAFGTAVPGKARRRADGRSTLSYRPPYGRSHYTVFTTSQTEALVGNTARLALVEPVRGLLAQRLDRTVRLSWEWPAGATSARARWWRIDDGPAAAQEAICRLRAYEDEGGFEVAADRHAWRVAVEAILDDVAGAVRSVPRTVDVPPAPTEVRYGVVPPSSRRDPAWRVWFRAAASCVLPDTLIVRSTGVMPLDPDSGSVVHVVPATRLDAGVQHDVELDIPGMRRNPLARRRDTEWLACFIDRKVDDAEVVLVPQSVHELRLN